MKRCGVAQSAEQRPVKPRVGRSNRPAAAMATEYFMCAECGHIWPQPFARPESHSNSSYTWPGRAQVKRRKKK